MKWVRGDYRQFLSATCLGPKGQIDASECACRCACDAFLLPSFLLGDQEDGPEAAPPEGDHPPGAGTLALSTLLLVHSAQRFGH